MTKHYKFEVVDDDRRRAPRYGRPTSPMWVAIRDGQTLLVADSDMRTINGARGWLKRQGYLLHVRTDSDGIVMWAEPVNGSKP